MTLDTIKEQAIKRFEEKYPNGMFEPFGDDDEMDSTDEVKSFLSSELDIADSLIRKDEREKVVEALTKGINGEIFLTPPLDEESDYVDGFNSGLHEAIIYITTHLSTPKEK